MEYKRPAPAMAGYILDTPNYPEKQYTSDNTLYDAAQGIIKSKEDAEKAKEPKRVKKNNLNYEVQS